MLNIAYLSRFCNEYAQNITFDKKRKYVRFLLECFNETSYTLTIVIEKNEGGRTAYERS